MPRLVPAVLAVAALTAAAWPVAPAGAADLPVQVFPLAYPSAATDIVSAGRSSFFADQQGSIGRIAPDGSVVHFPTPLGAPQHLIVGPNGVLWYTAKKNGASKVLGRMTQDGQPLFNAAPASGDLEGLTVGVDGNVFATEHTQIAKFSPSGQLLAEYDAGAWARGITSGPDGNLWAADTRNSASNPAGIIRMTPTGTVTEFTSGVGPTCPSAQTQDRCSSPTDITVGPDGALWYTLSHTENAVLGGGAIGRISTGGIAAYQSTGATSAPTGIVAGPDNALYAVDAVRGVLIRTLIFSGSMTESPIDKGGPGSSASLPHAGIALGADGALWIAGNAYNEVARVSPPVPPRPTTGNLLVNADGETEPNRRATGPGTTVPLAGWATSPNFTAAAFMAHGGDGVLWGGPGSFTSYARQLVDVSSLADVIDGERRTATVAGQIGGSGGQGDHGTLTMRFIAPDGTVLGDASTEPVAPTDLPAIGGYANRDAKDLLPIGTRYIEVEALAQRVSGNANDAYFDDLSLTLDPLPAPPLPEPVGAGPGSGSGSQAPQSGTGKPGTPGPTTTGPGTPGTPSGPAKPLTVTVAPLTSTTLKPLATGGPTTTDPKAGTPIVITLSAAARVTVRFDRAAPGRRKGKTCVAPAKAKRGARACTRYVTRGSFVVDQPAGPSTIRLTGRLDGKKLPRGTYRVVITPAGGASTTVTLRVR